jgi:hypothetical protein
VSGDVVVSGARALKLNTVSGDTTVEGAHRAEFELGQR